MHQHTIYTSKSPKSVPLFLLFHSSCVFLSPLFSFSALANYHVSFSLIVSLFRELVQYCRPPTPPTPPKALLPKPPSVPHCIGPPCARIGPGFFCITLVTSMHMEIGASILAANSPSPAFFTPKAPHCAPPTITCRGCWDIMLRATQRPTIEAHGRGGQGSEQGYTSRQDTLPWVYQHPHPSPLTHSVPGFDTFNQNPLTSCWLCSGLDSKVHFFLQSDLHCEIKPASSMLHLMKIIICIFPLFLHLFEHHIKKELRFVLSGDHCNFSVLVLI